MHMSTQRLSLCPYTVPHTEPSSEKGLQTGLLERNGLQAVLWQMIILPTSVKKGLLLPTLLLSDWQLQTALPSYHPRVAGDNLQEDGGWGLLLLPES